MQSIVLDTRHATAQNNVYQFQLPGQIRSRTIEVTSAVGTVRFADEYFFVCLESPFPGESCYTSSELRNVIARIAFTTTGQPIVTPISYRFHQNVELSNIHLTFRDYEGNAADLMSEFLSLSISISP
jgi:hypothetical protein